jgi:hypothetical protein
VDLDTVGNALEEGRISHGVLSVVSSDEGLKLLEDLLFRREACFLLLGKENVIVRGDYENAAAAAYELALDTQCLLDLGRQTGGPGKVVSNAAVVDSNVHGNPR